MIRFSSVLFLLIVLLSVLAVPAFAQPAPDTVYISEVSYAGSVADNQCKNSGTNASKCSNDKWFEVYNPSSVAVNLQGWKIGIGNRKDGSGNYATTATINQNLQILPRSPLVISSKDSGLNSVLDISGVNHFALASLFGMSNNTPSLKYLRVALISPENIRFERFIENLDLIEKNNSIDQTKGKKTTLEFDSEGNPSFASSAFFGNNFGSPASVFIPVSKSDTIPEPDVVGGQLPVTLPSIPDTTLGAAQSPTTMPESVADLQAVLELVPTPDQLVQQLPQTQPVVVPSVIPEITTKPALELQPQLEFQSFSEKLPTSPVTLQPQEKVQSISIFTPTNIDQAQTKSELIPAVSFSQPALIHWYNGLIVQMSLILCLGVSTLVSGNSLTRKAQIETIGSV